MAEFGCLSLPGARVTLCLYKRSRYFQLRRVRPSPLQQHLHRHITPPHQRVLAASSASVAHFAPSFLPCLLPHNRSPVAGGRAPRSRCCLPATPFPPSRPHHNIIAVRLRVCSPISSTIINPFHSAFPHGSKIGLAMRRVGCTWVSGRHRASTPPNSSDRRVARLSWQHQK